jgi:hypothetical protein
VVDDPALDVDRKLELLAEASDLLELLERAPAEVAHRDQSGLFAELAECVRPMPGWSVEPYRGYLDCLNEIVRWPQMPVFADRADLAAFNRRFFSCIVGVMGAAFAEPLVRVGERALSFEVFQERFVEFMQGMQMVNLLMDLEEDVQAGQYWIPASENDGAATTKRTGPLLDRYLLLGSEFLARGAVLCDPLFTGAVVSSFFTRLRLIFEGLERHLRDQVTRTAAG